MTRLAEIPVVEVKRCALPAAPAQGSTDSILAILGEIEANLEALAARGTSATIDLRWLSRVPGGIEPLREALGEGEVRAEIGVLGATLVRETAIPCVWWIIHRDFQDQTIGEFIEIVELPSILASDRADIARGRALLAWRRDTLAAGHQSDSSVSPQ